jgi:SP family sugar:H+ symporter-like MFS transporter
MASLMCCVSNVIMMTTTNLAGLYAGRLLIGIANGWYMTFSQLYIQVRIIHTHFDTSLESNITKECSPARYRGLLISVFQIWTSIGTLVGTVVDNATHAMEGKNSYIIPLATIYFVPVVITIGLFFIPESPRWLMLLDKQEQASKAMLWLRPDPATVPEELAEIQAAIDVEKATKHTANFMDIWRDPVDRRRTLLSIAAISTQAASGAMFMIAYGTYFFQMAHVGSPFMNSCILVAVGVFAITVNSCVISKIGRRRVFLMTGLSICGVCQIAVAAVYHVNPNTVSTGKVNIFSQSILDGC